MSSAAAKRIIWLAALTASICFEGLGRKFLPVIPSFVLYFLKDAVLLAGWLAFGVSPLVLKAAATLYKGFGPVLLLAFLWTVGEMANPYQQSLSLAVLGLRAYWLWWTAPLLIAETMSDRRVQRAALYILSATTLIVAGNAAFQFASPPDAAVNTYALYEGRAVAEVATAGATGRARVSSTFSYISGFVDFVIIVPALLLAITHDAEDRRVRRLALLAIAAAAAVMPMAGSRGAVIIGLILLAIVAYSAGFLATRIGRRVIVAVVVAGAAALAAFPDAMEGVTGRFQLDDTMGRFMEVAQVLPPVAMGSYDYPIIGIGTGMQQNGRIALGIQTELGAEGEPGRLLVELGAVGYLLIWLSKLGLSVALLRCARILRTAKRRAAAGGAIALAVLAIIGNLSFDHIWQALFFVGLGFILREVLAVTGHLPQGRRSLLRSGPIRTRPTQSAAGGQPAPVLE